MVLKIMPYTILLCMEMNVLHQIKDWTMLKANSKFSTNELLVNC